MRFTKKFLTAFLVSALLVGSGAAARVNPNSGFDMTRLDKSCKPCDDFYQFTNGGWLARESLPQGFPRWSSFDALAESNRAALHRILESAAKDSKAPENSRERLIGDFYASCMDEAKIEAAGTGPLAADLARIGRIKDREELPKVIAHLHNQGVGALFSFGSSPDAKNNSQVIGIAGQGGLSLPNRDFYTKDDERSKNVRSEFVSHVSRMFGLLGDEPARAAAGADTVMAIQMKLAQASMTPVQTRDPNATYNKMSTAQLARLTPAFSWGDYIAGRGTPKLNEVNIAQPEFYKEMNRLLTDVPLADWKTYLRWHLLTDAAPFLSKKFDGENFNFYGRILSGTKEQLPRWKRCVARTDEALGEALGQVYVKTEFTPESKERMIEMIRNLRSAFGERLSKLDWMSEETRKEAFAKLDAFKFEKIGYPEKWRDYTGLLIDRDSYLANVRRAVVFEGRRQLNKIGKPVDRTEWLMTPPEVNAYYHTYNVEIVFPAGILQPPFFNARADDAINYGAIGAVIGHEFTHGFDDQGSQFDARGNLRMWWTTEDRRNFDGRASCIIKQFGDYRAVDGTLMKGELVAGEAIADLGGLNVAYAAFMKSREGKPRPADIDGFTPEQRFFLGFAQVWASLYTPEAERLQALSNVHPITRYRANGTLANMPQFAAAFNCRQGDTMVRPPSDRCQIW